MNNKEKQDIIGNNRHEKFLWERNLLVSHRYLILYHSDKLSMSAYVFIVIICPSIYIELTYVGRSDVSL